MMFHARKYYVACGLVVLCIGLAGAELLYEKHPHVAYEEWFNFYGFYGLIATVALLWVGHVVRVLLQRGDDYYDG